MKIRRGILTAKNDDGRYTNVKVVINTADLFSFNMFEFCSLARA